MSINVCTYEREQHKYCTDVEGHEDDDRKYFETEKLHTILSFNWNILL